MEHDEDVLLPAVDGPDDPPAGNTYHVHAHCGNCGRDISVDIPVGTAVGDATCPKCHVAGQLRRTP